MDYNTANRRQIMKIPGIGKVTSGRIITYRRQNGPITVWDLITIPGIGEKRLRALQRWDFTSIDTKSFFDFLGGVFFGCVFFGCVFFGCVSFGCVFFGCVFLGCIFLGCVFLGCIFLGFLTLLLLACYFMIA